MAESVLAGFRLVLVAPMYSGNVGAIARVAANFNLRDLTAVSPQCDLDDEQARLYGKGPAREFLAGIKTMATLTEALDGCIAAVAFSRREGKGRRAFHGLGELLAARDLGELTGQGQESAGAGAGAGAHPVSKVALVFGREDSGLTNEELLHCTHVCQLATAEIMPSLNLSHSVAVVLSRLYEKLAAPKPHDLSPRERPATTAELDGLVEHWHQAMIDAGLTEAGNPERMLAYIQRVLRRAGLSLQETSILRGYLSKTQVAMGTRRREGHNAVRKAKP